MRSDPTNGGLLLQGGAVAERVLGFCLQSLHTGRQSIKLCDFSHIMVILLAASWSYRCCILILDVTIQPRPELLDTCGDVNGLFLPGRLDLNCMFLAIDR